MSALIIAVAGGLGAGTRHVVDIWLGRYTRWTLHLINISGSLALGFVVAVVGPDAPLALTVGFLGGFTTLSAASLQAAQMILDGTYARAAAHALSMSLGCVAAACFGFWLGA